MHIDIHKLKVAMFAKGETNTSISKKLNIDRNTFPKWLNKETIPLNMIYKLIAILELSDEEAWDIFFCRTEEDVGKFII